MAGGVDPTKRCLYDIASLRFKFNEVASSTQKFMTSHPESDCGDVKKTLELVQRTVGDLMTKLRLEKSIGVQPGTPVVRSTPNKQPARSEYHTAESSIGPTNTTASRKVNATFDVSGRPAMNATFDVSANESSRPTSNATRDRPRSRRNETFDVSRKFQQARATSCAQRFTNCGSLRGNSQKFHDDFRYFYHALNVP